ncbi:MAG TPA: VOC family protein [Acidimicrobiales bacterium]|nr:VOC family protein [Acidimicrobiales bacterium]
MGQPVVHFEILGEDADKLHRFYSDLFGWKIQSMPMDGGIYGMVSREDNLNREGVGIGGGIGSAPAPGHVTFYVEVPDVEESLSRAERMGGRRVMGPMTVPEDTVIGLFQDPEDHLVGLVQSARH